MDKSQNLWPYLRPGIQLLDSFYVIWQYFPAVQQIQYLTLKFKVKVMAKATSEA